MLAPLVAASLGATLANAIAIRAGCEVHFTAGGAITGPVGQIESGQVRAGSGVQSTGFTLDGGALRDPKGRGCWWTPPAKVLQCDDNQTPEQGFTIDCNGAVSFNGKTTFYECETDQKDEFNVYAEPNPNGVNCHEITLKADGCHKECPKPTTQAPPPPKTTAPAPAPKPTTTQQPAPPPAPKGCPTDLSGSYEFPHLIVPVDSSKPDEAPGTSYFGQVSKTVSSIFNFDIPSGDKGKQCSLVFLFPKQEDLETSSFTFSGAGGLDFSKLKSAAKDSTTSKSVPAQEKDYGVTTVAPGNSYLISTFDCPAGETVAFEISAKDDTSFKFFQDYNPSPIGLYITKC